MGGTNRKTTPTTSSTTPNTPTTGLRERGNDTSKSSGRSGRQKAATRRNMRREERVTVQGPVKEQQPDGMSHGGGLPPPPLLKRSPGRLPRCTASRARGSAVRVARRQWA